MNKQLLEKKLVKPKGNKYLFTRSRIDGLLHEQRLKEKIKIILRFVHPFYCNWEACSNFFTRALSLEIAKIKKKEAKDQVARPFYIPGRNMYITSTSHAAVDPVSLRPFEVRVDKTSSCPVFLTSPIVIYVPTRASLAVETKGLLFLWLTHLKNNLCYQTSSLFIALLVGWRMPTFLHIC